MSIEEVIAEVEKVVDPPSPSSRDVVLPLIEITGGEPLLQKSVLPLMDQLCDKGFKVLIETSGAHRIQEVNPAVCRIMDLKCPSSGESDRMLWDNIQSLRDTDEVKFVIASEEDYEWAKQVIDRYDLARICPILFSSVAPLTPSQQSQELKVMPDSHTVLSREGLVESVLRDRLPVRFQLQMHKFIWPPDQTGV
jgi:7-carboxy-7-deazaguanine synthase